MTTLLTLDDWLCHAWKLHTKRIELGLDRVLSVYRKLRVTIQSRVVLVAGTNGKGSSIALMEALLLGQKRSVCSYTSPHILKFNERLRVNGEAIDDASLIAAFAEVETARGDIVLSYFEFSTLAILLVIEDLQPDFALLEVGLGGRLDAVNIVEPEVSLITSIGLDHTEWLGESLEEIGYEKAGIMRYQGKCVVGEQQPPDSIIQQAKAQHSELYVIGSDFGWCKGEHLSTLNSADFRAELVENRQSEAVLQLITRRHETSRLTLPVSGAIASSNQASALQVLAMLGALPEEQMIRQTISELQIVGRFEQNLPFIFDVAHNEQAVMHLVAQLRALRVNAPSTQVVCMFSALGDKRLNAMISALSDDVNHWCIWQLDTERAASLKTLEDELNAVSARYSAHKSAEDAMLHAQRFAESELSYILVTGSFHTLTEAKVALGLT